MMIGDIYVWDTNRAVGHDTRRKYHLYIGEAGWRDDGHAFLFISSHDYGNDYRILREDYPFLTKEESFVSCNGIVVYPTLELKQYSITKVSALRPEHAQELHSSLAGSETMEGWQIRLCCEAISQLI